VLLVQAESLAGGARNGAGVSARGVRALRADPEHTPAREEREADAAGATDPRAAERARRTCARRSVACHAALALLARPVARRQTDDLAEQTGRTFGARAAAGVAVARLRCADRAGAGARARSCFDVRRGSIDRARRGRACIGERRHRARPELLFRTRCCDDHHQDDRHRGDQFQREPLPRCRKRQLRW